MRAEDLGREVNRLYWDSEEPVTRLAGKLSVSRGTFYNHLRPLPAGVPCPACGSRLLFRNRSSRETGDAHCGECGTEQNIADKARARGREARTTAGSGKAASPPPRAAGLRSARSAFTERVSHFDDAQKTRLLVIAVGAAAVGLGLLYYSRHRS